MLSVLISVLPAFEVPFGSQEGRVTSNYQGEEDVTLPYAAFAANGKLHILEPIRRRILVLDFRGRLLREIELNQPDLIAWHPFRSMALVGHRYVLLSQRNAGILLYDPVLNQIRVMNDSQSAMSQVQAPTGLGTFGDYISVLDSVNGFVQIFSRRGSLLGGLPAQGMKESLPYSATEILAIRENEDLAEIRLLSMRGGDQSFYLPKMQEGDEFVSLKFIGMDPRGFVYVEKTSGPRHGTPLVSILKLSPMGEVFADVLTEATTRDMLELSFRFVLVAEDALFQIHLNEGGLGFKPLRLKTPPTPP